MPGGCASLLRPGGRLLNHGIAKLKDLDTPDEGPFSERFVFPDGVPLPLSRVIGALERTGLVTTHVEGLAADYAKTLSYWIERFDARWDDAMRLAGIERARIWRLYLRAGAAGLRDRMGFGLPGARPPLSAFAVADLCTPDATHFTPVYPVGYRRD